MVTARPSAPTWVMVGPMARRYGRIRSSAAVSPPTMKLSCPCAMVTVLPDTGASSRVAPFAATRSPSMRVTAGLTVLISAQTAPLPSPASMPSGRSATSRSASESVTMLSTTSAPSAAARAESATIRPLGARASALARVLLWPVTGWPAARRRWTMALPMAPSPTKAILDISPSCRAAETPAPLRTGTCRRPAPVRSCPCLRPCDPWWAA